jgi:predicted CXXCH cytochrome family protein
VVLALAAVILAARTFLVPGDFGIQQRGYMYGWHRQSNVEEWKALPAKFQGGESCRACHSGEAQKLSSAPHKTIQCENCHGPALDHPSKPLKLLLDRSRALCLRCHAELAYPNSQRSEIKGIDPDRHHAGMECAVCHDPHAAAKPRAETKAPSTVKPKGGKPRLEMKAAPVAKPLGEANVAPAAKFRGSEYCQTCHSGQAEKLSSALHKPVQCESCHGPALDHPSQPPKLPRDRNRALCLKCHAQLAAPNSQRSGIRGIHPDQHNAGMECAVCHDPHATAKPR